MGILSLLLKVLLWRNLGRAWLLLVLLELWVRVFLQSLQVPAASWGCGGKGQRGLRSAPSTVLWAAASVLQNLLDHGCLLTEGESACFSPTGQLIKGSSWKGAKAQVGTCEPLC